MTSTREQTRLQILEVAADLVERDGVQAVSTRSVAAAAGIRAASLYQYFGDKDGLLAALAVHAFERYLDSKQAMPVTHDPVTDICRGWDAHVDFGLRHPAFYLLMFGSDRPGRLPPATEEATRQLSGFLDRVAAAGRLRLPPVLAAQLMMAAVTGATFTLIALPTEKRDTAVSTSLRNAVVSALVTDPPPNAGAGLASRALGLDAALTASEEDSLPLREAELALLRDWLHLLTR